MLVHRQRSTLPTSLQSSWRPFLLPTLPESQNVWSQLSLNFLILMMMIQKDSELTDSTQLVSAVDDIFRLKRKFYCVFNMNQCRRAVSEPCSRRRRKHSP